MKKSSLKRTSPVQHDRVVVLKPFGFCCERKGQDPETRYDKQRPPFENSLTDVVVASGGPGLKFRVQEVTALPYPNQRIASRIKSAAFLGDCKRCRPPLRWYLEDEIDVARDMFASERQTRYNFEMERNVEVAKRREKWRRDHRRARKIGRKL